MNCRARWKADRAQDVRIGAAVRLPGSLRAFRIRCQILSTVSDCILLRLGMGEMCRDMSSVTRGFRSEISMGWKVCYARLVKTLFRAWRNVCRGIATRGRATT